MESFILSARSTGAGRSAAIIIACCLAVGTLSSCGTAIRRLQGESEPPGPVSPPRSLTNEEMDWARSAWGYFQANDHQATGFSNSVAGYPVTTAGEIGDTLAAIITARNLGLTDHETARQRIGRIVAMLGRMPLSNGALPHRLYDSDTGAMIIQPGQNGDIGWSAVDIGRLLIWLKASARQFPELQDATAGAVARFRLCDAVGTDGGLMGASMTDDGPAKYREAGRGYELYASRGYRLWGVDLEPPVYAYPKVPTLGSYNPGAKPQRPDQFIPILTGDLTLSGIEFGWAGADREAQNWRAQLLWQVHESRRLNEGKVVARNEFLRSAAPYFVFGTAIAGDKPWAVLTPSGEERPDLALVSTKAAFGLWTLWPEKSGPLYDKIRTLPHDGGGWVEGVYEIDGSVESTRSASTNAAVLEALHYRSAGPIIAAEPQGNLQKCPAK